MAKIDFAKRFDFELPKDNQAIIKSSPNACEGYSLDLSISCSHHCIYCIFSQTTKLLYKLKNPDYQGSVVPLKIDRLLEKEPDTFPPAVYLSYSSDPLGNAEITELTIQVLKKLFSAGVSIFFISKGKFTDEVIETMKLRPDLMNVQVGITSQDEQRNKVIEPGALSYQERLENLEKLSRVDNLSTICVRIDPMLMGIDDTVENYTRILSDIKQRGINEISTGYLILPKIMRELLKRNPYLTDSLKGLTEVTDTISGQTLYSWPFEEKLKKIKELESLCNSMDIKMRVCGCKEKKFKETDLNWVCHPFSSPEEREEVMQYLRTKDFS